MGRGFRGRGHLAARTGRRGKEQQAELAEIESLIAAGKVLSTRIVRTVIDRRDTYRMQMVCDGHPTRSTRSATGGSGWILGPARSRSPSSDDTWTGWIEPFADRLRLNTMRLRRRQRHLDRQHRAGSPDCFSSTAPTRRAVATGGSVPARRAGRRGCGWAHRRLADTVRRCTAGWPTGCSPTARYGVREARLRRVAKNFPCSVRDRAPGLLVKTMRRKAETAGGNRLYEFNTRTTALRKPVCAGTTRKSRSTNGSTVVNAASKNTGTCFRLPGTTCPPGG